MTDRQSTARLTTRASLDAQRRLDFLTFGVASLIATVLVLPKLLVRILPDDFRHRGRRHDYAKDRHPIARHAIVAVKNGVGALLILAGIAMLVLPGQGLLTLLIGLMLTDLPGNYRLEKRIVGQLGVLKAVNWLRGRAGHPPVLAPLDRD